MCHYANVEYKGMTTVDVTYYTNQTPSKHFRQNKCLRLSTPKNTKIFINVHTIGNPHLQCVDNHNAKIEYKGMKNLHLGVTEYKNLKNIN